jgi:hypothetical protein
VTWTRLEARIGAGMPDINGVIPEGEFWVELKVCKTKKYSTAGLWRPLQVAWQMSRASVFPNVWNVVSHPSSDVVYIYRCEKVFKLSAGEGSVIPDMVLYTADWNAFIDYVRDGLTKRKDMD